MGFNGVVVTDAVEMRAVAGRYGIAGAAVRALVAGADAICVGGEHADEETARHLRDTIVAAVVTGELPEERLAEAAKRVGQLAAWTMAARAARPDDAARPASGGSAIGLAAARRALRVTVADRAAPALPLTVAPHVVEFAPPHNIAIGSATPWGVAAPLTEVMPGTTSVRWRSETLPTDPIAGAAGRPLVLVVRDLHRHGWMRAAVDRALAQRPDAVVVELGVPARVVGAVHVATHGATRATGRAVAELLGAAAVSPGW
ncbi:hypothetical protein Jiend_07730 [Micromonospora endophytica]|nr:hypothetical protein Jiend_07730 [Micromonospora endophytica]